MLPLRALLCAYTCQLMKSVPSSKATLITSKILGVNPLDKSLSSFSKYLKFGFGMDVCLNLTGPVNFCLAFNYSILEVKVSQLSCDQFGSNFSQISEMFEVKTTEKVACCFICCEMAHTLVIINGRVQTVS